MEGPWFSHVRACCPYPSVERLRSPGRMTRRENLRVADRSEAVDFTPVRMRKNFRIDAFKIRFDPNALGDLKQRLRTARWADAIGDDWSEGTDEHFLRSFIAYWRDDYDWESRVAGLNMLPHYRATIDGFGVHFLHFRSRHKNARPLLLMNGWPSSFIEYLRLVPLLIQEHPAFHVIIPALPGFGFSDRPRRPCEVEPVELFRELMEELNYDRFFVAGTDIGAGIATRMALRYGTRIIGAHVGSALERPRRPGDVPTSVAELAYRERARLWHRDEGAYQSLQSSKPQTLAFALADSPVGLASWILEKFRGWSDCRGNPATVFPLQTLADNLTIYWMTNTIGSSLRHYYDAERLQPPLRSEDYVRVPTAVAMFPKDVGVAPREFAERLYNVTRYTVFERGGHFPAWEQPELYAADLRAFAESLNG